MTLAQREILKGFMDDYDKRIDQVYYLRGGKSSKETIFVEYTHFRKDGSGEVVKLTFDPDGYCSGTTRAEVRT